VLIILAHQALGRINYLLSFPYLLKRKLIMNAFRLYNIDTTPSPSSGFACATLYSAVLPNQDETLTLILRNEDKTAMT
jgi:hypothetical protein